MVGISLVSAAHFHELVGASFLSSLLNLTEIVEQLASSEASEKQ